MWVDNKVEKHFSLEVSCPKPQATRRNWASRATCIPQGTLSDTVMQQSGILSPRKIVFHVQHGIVRENISSYFDWRCSFKHIKKVHFLLNLSFHVKAKLLWLCKCQWRKKSGFLKLTFRWNNGVFSPKNIKSFNYYIRMDWNLKHRHKIRMYYSTVAHLGF